MINILLQALPASSAGLLRRSWYAARRRCMQTLKDGHILGIFPEGTRSKTGQVGKVKSGAFVIASAAGVPMVPCRIIYDTPDKRMHMFCRIRICFGTPIPAEEMKVEDPRRSVPKLRALRTRLKTELERLYEENHF